MAVLRSNLEGLSMADYHLVFSAGTGAGQSGRIATADASRALLLAHRHGQGRPVEVWKGDRMLCRVAESGEGGFWEIS
ncbi:MAG: hypothetical protein Q8R44_13840 [Novosphingobium sp.]|nr:hypothetical protein [Novosphingobium sp.]